MLCKHLSVEPNAPETALFFWIDTDPQGTLTAWHTKREADIPARVDLPFIGMEKGLELMRSHGAAYCIIDTASGRLAYSRRAF